MEPTKKLTRDDVISPDDAYEALRDPANDANFVLVPCTCNGEAAIAISAVFDNGVLNGKRLKAVRPLFVSVTPGMRLVDTRGQEAVSAEKWKARDERAFPPDLLEKFEVLLEKLHNGREQRDPQ